MSQFEQLDRFYRSGAKPPHQGRRSLNFAHMGGGERTTPAGPALEIVRHYDWDAVPARSSFEAIRDTGWIPAHISPRLLGGVDLNKAVFVDVETTGLSLGAGNVAFLIAAAHADRDGFTLRQFLMRDFSEEAAQQMAVAETMEHFDLMVTYNGATFDLPVLRTRAVINRIEAPWLERPHLDLLHPVRAVWRNVWPDCRLGTAEARLLGVIRDVDCESWEVPLRYRQFLNEQSEEPLVEVLEHNAQDVLSLAGLTAVVQQLFAPDRGHFGLTQEEMFGLARALANRGRHEQSIQLLLDARAMGKLTERYPLAMRMLVRLLKRSRRWHEASEVWREFSDADDAHDRLWAFIEEAKQFEHRVKDFARALQFVDRAEQTLCMIPQALDRERLTKSLTHRRQRLNLRQKAR
jgi:uncharacterized protein YprB with RNaseH-like and TPR domain